ncbi:MAG: phosphonate ABC transporter substrate-binding protein [Alphaproteobacteria bacterium]|nr:phosphonate ABC transporter substrate-binding protein [Alphaproteobacteria bacterium]
MTRLVLVLFLLIGAGVARAESFRFAVTDVVGVEGIRRAYEPFREALRTVGGIDLIFTPMSHRMMAVQLLADRRVDLVHAGPSEYVVLHHRTSAVPIVGIERQAYYPVLLVRVDSEVRSIADLAGRHVGLGPRGSTSRHLGPIQLLADHGLLDRRDFQVQNLKVPLLVDGLRRGNFAAIGVNNGDAVRYLAASDGGGIRILERGPALPMDVLVVPPDLPVERRDRLRTVIAAHGAALATAIARGAEMEAYRSMRWVLDPIDDARFDAVRRMYVTIGLPEFARFAD